MLLIHPFNIKLNLYELLFCKLEDVVPALTPNDKILWDYVSTDDFVSIRTREPLP